MKTKTYTLTTLGLSGKAWVKRLERNGYRIGTYAKDLLLSAEFEKARPKKGETIEIAIVKHSDIASPRTTDAIKAHAAAQGFTVPFPEVGCLLREQFSDADIEEMGLWYITTLHDPIKDSGGDPSVLYAGRRDDGRWLGAYWDGPGGRWSVGGASAFLVPASASSSEPESSENLGLLARVERIEKILAHHRLEV